MNTFIVNADDFGRDEETTRAIMECFQRGYVNQTTLMVNMPYAEKAVELARQAGIANRVGLHLNLTQGTPLTDTIKKISAFCNRTGDFLVNRVGCNGKRLPKNMLNAIAEEVRAQVARYISYGLPLMHCDGHHHAHNRLGLYSTILPILKDAGFRSVRNRYTVFGPLWCGVRGRMGNWRFRRFIKHLGLASTEAFGGWNGDTLGKWSRFGSVEIMVHPHYDMNGSLVNVIDSGNNTGPEMRLLQVN